MNDWNSSEEILPSKKGFYEVTNDKNAVTFPHIAYLLWDEIGFFVPPAYRKPTYWREITHEKQS